MPTVTTVLVAVVNLVFVADLLRMKLALTPTTTTSTTSSTPSSSTNGRMDGGPRVQGQRLRDVLRPAASATEASMFSGDVSDDEDLTLGSGSGMYLPGLDTDTPPHTPLLHTLKDDRRSRPYSSCCFVGKMAASRHLHCLAQYHVDKLRMGRKPTEVMHSRRHSALKRPHKRLPVHWPRDFPRCVLERPLVFEKCCYGYATTRNDRLRWYNHRKARTGSLQNSYHSWRYIYS